MRAQAQALKQEVLFYARQNLTDIQTQQAVCVNGYLSLDVPKKTAREMINGCTRVASTGMSALAVAQTVAQATNNQVRVMEMLQGVNATIGNLISETGRQLEHRARRQQCRPHAPGLTARCGGAGLAARCDGHFGAGEPVAWPRGGAEGLPQHRL
jgi:hypothetical protein